MKNAEDIESQFKSIELFPRPALNVTSQAQV